MSSSEEETSPVKGSSFKENMKCKEKQEKVKFVQEVVDDDMAEVKDTTKKKKGKTSKEKCAKDWKEDKVSMLI